MKIQYKPMLSQLLIKEASCYHGLVFITYMHWLQVSNQCTKIRYTKHQVTTGLNVGVERFIVDRFHQFMNVHVTLKVPSLDEKGPMTSIHIGFDYTVQ